MKRSSCSPLNMRPDISPDELAERLRRLSPEEVELGNAAERAQSLRDYEDFRTSLDEGDCFLCRKPLTSFSASRPCLHWLMKPKGFKKKHFPLLTEKFCYFRVAAYVRWLASLDGIARNINDLVAEHSGSKLIDLTARYRNITWSFSCGATDYRGHEGSRNADFPHYHFQMIVGGRPFIRYNDFHIPLHADDLYDLELIANHRDLVLYGTGPGMGMQALLDDADLAVGASSPATDPETAALNLDTLIVAREGETLSGHDLVAAVTIAAAQKRSLASVVQERFTNADVATFVSPGEGVAKAKPRSTRRKKERNGDIDCEGDGAAPTSPSS